MCAAQYMRATPCLALMFLLICSNKKPFYKSELSLMVLVNVAMSAKMT